MKLDIAAFYIATIEARSLATSGGPLILDLKTGDDRRYPGDLELCFFTDRPDYAAHMAKAINEAQAAWDREIEAERTRQAEAENYQRIFGEPMPVIDQEEPDSLTPEEPF